MMPALFVQAVLDSYILLLEACVRMNLDVHRHVLSCIFVTRITIMPVSNKNSNFCDLLGFRDELRKVAKTNSPSIIKKDGSLKFPGQNYDISPQNWSNATNGLSEPNPHNLRHLLVAVHASAKQAEEIMSYLGRNFFPTPYDKALRQCLEKGDYRDWFDVADYISSKTGQDIE